MTDQRFTPEEFARLIALPADHPERRRAEQDPRFDAWCRMLEAFESRDSHGLDAGEARTADLALAKRLESAIGVASGAGVDAPRTARHIVAPREGRRFWPWLSPQWVPALAAAAVLVVAGVWLAGPRGSGERVVRGEAQALVVSVRETPAGRELSWTPVAGADEYRVTFLGADLRELARVEKVTVPRLQLRREALPAGLTAGAEVAVQVTALRAGGAIGESRTITVKLPSN